MLLLAVAVILPTVCLLWFMTQAVKNERLAVKEKLGAVYENQLSKAIEENLSEDRLSLNLSIVAADGVVVYDANGNVTFPVIDVEESEPNSELFKETFKLEFIEQKLDEAIVEYQRIRKVADDENSRFAAEIAEARCLDKLGKNEEAIEKIRQTMSKYGDGDISLRSQKCRGKMLLLDMIFKSEKKGVEKEVNDLFEYSMRGMLADEDFSFLGRKPQADRYIPSSLQVFALEKFLEHVNKLPSDQELNKRIKRAERQISLVETSIEFAEIYQRSTFVKNNNILNSKLFSLDGKRKFYGQYSKNSSYTRLHINEWETVEQWFEGFIGEIKQLSSDFAIYDDGGRLVAGKNSKEKPFISMELGGYLSEWRAELYLDDLAFDNAASKQSTIYIWTGVLVVVLIITSGAVATQAIGRQIKLNRMKNDFIATVTHELKTPLSSMRVLTDTLLEGNLKEEGQRDEYLELISKENERLSRLIDNFLTFSRMERNKQAFVMKSTDVREVVDESVCSIQTKLNKENCDFNVNVCEDLPSILIDKDAIVTVLVNLLDNACKYSNGDKEISLNVYKAGDSICFAVQDNGIGMSGRQVKKIFDRFYQADSSLSRKAEGAGLGLSIVKFIVDAHKGSIEVNSKQGYGSEFIVKLPR